MDEYLDNSKMMIDRIILERTVTIDCPLGNQLCAVVVTMDFQPGETLPEYISLDRKIEGFNRTKNTIESLCASVRKLLIEMGAIDGVVKCSAGPSKHGPVTVLAQIQRQVI